MGEQLRGSSEGQRRLAERAAERAAAEAAATEAAERKRDTEALVQMVAAYHDDLARIAFLVSGLPGLAQEAAQAAWAAVWRARASMRNPERLQARLLGFAATEARALSDTGEASQDAIGEAGAPTTQAASAPAYRSDELALVNALAELEVVDRQIIALRYVGNLDADQIGTELGMPGTAVLARVARIIDRFTKDPRLAPPLDETVDEYERQVALRIHSLTDRAVDTVDPAAVAQAAIDSMPEASSTERLDALLEGLVERARATDRRVWYAVAGGVAVVLVGALVLGRLGSGSGDGGSNGAIAVATPVPTDATRLCIPSEIAARITSWVPTQTALIASVEIRNTSGRACLQALSAPLFTDKTSVPLVTGTNQEAGVRIGPGETLRTRVHVGNYCGPAPQPPVTLAFRQGTDVIRLDPLVGSATNGIPPCMDPAARASIIMDPWAP